MSVLPGTALLIPRGRLHADIGRAEEYANRLLSVPFYEYCVETRKIESNSRLVLDPPAVVCAVYSRFCV